MDLKTKLLAEKFRNISYFKDLHEYIIEKIEQNSLSYDNLRYLYNNLYKNNSEFIKQNIYPVCEFLLQGFTYEECEKIANTLEDASDGAFFYDKKDTGKLYNKYFYELRFSYLTYNNFVIQGDSREIAFEKMKNIKDYNLEELKKELECRIINDYYLYHSETESYLKDIEKQREKLETEFKLLIDNDPEIENKFKNDISKDFYSNITVAGNIVNGIDKQYNSSNINRKIEKYPFNEQELKLIDSYSRLNQSMEILENYIEHTYTEDISNDMEME